MKLLVVLSASLSFTAAAVTFDQFDAAGYVAANVITRDIAVIGGGATGTYAAIKLGDLGKSVVLVEKAGRLGVSAYFNNSIVTDFFAKFHVPVPRQSQPTSRHPGYFLPDPVPADLLLTWPDYIQKHGLTSIHQPTLSRAPGSGNPLDILAIYYFTSINEALFREQQGLAITTAHRDGSELFRKALAELGPNALLSSVVIAASRPKKGSAKLVVKTPTGNKLIIAKQVVLGIPPVIDNLKPFGLDSHKSGILSQPVGHLYYAGLVSNTGLSTAHIYNNIGTNSPYNVPMLPGAAMFNPTVLNGTFLYWHTSLTPMTQAQVQSAVTTEIQGLQKATGGQATTPTHLAWADHSPFHLIRVRSSAQGLLARAFRLSREIEKFGL